MSAVGDIRLTTLAPAAATVLSTSDAAVGYNKTFSPAGWSQNANGVMSYEDRSGGVPLLYPRITFQVRTPTRESQVYKVSTKLFYPVAETIDPAVGIFGPRVAYEIQYHADWLIHMRSTNADRQTALSLVTSLFMDSIAASDGNPTNTTGSPLVAAVRSLDAPY